jgi:hypothetical protein
MALPLETVRSLDLIRLYEALGVGSHLVIPNRHDGIQFRVLLQTLAHSQNLVKIGTVGRGADRWTGSKMSSEAVISRPT